jgi:hypothetical protein
VWRPAPRALSWLLSFAPAYDVLRDGAGGTVAALPATTAMVYLGVALGIDEPFAVFAFIFVVALAVARLLGVPRGRVGALMCGRARLSRPRPSTCARRIPTRQAAGRQPAAMSGHALFGGGGWRSWR